MINEDVEYLKAFRERIGTSRYDAAVKKINRQRLEVDVEKRQKRVTFRWSLYKRLYEKQAGRCNICKHDMRLIRGEIEIDHRNPNDPNFNGEHNLQAVHKDCNRTKGGKSLAEQAKFYGKTTVELLSGGNE